MHEPVAIRCCVKQRQQLPEDTTVIYIAVTNEPSSQFARFDRLIGWLCSQQWRPPANHYTSLSLRFALIAFDAISAEVMFSGHVCLITSRVTEKVIGGFPWNLRTNVILQELLNFWATVCKTVRLMLSDLCPVCSVCLFVCSVCLSVTLVYCGQTVARIKTKLGIQVALVEVIWNIFPIFMIVQ